MYLKRASQDAARNSAVIGRYMYVGDAEDGIYNGTNHKISNLVDAHNTVCHSLLRMSLKGYLWINCVCAAMFNGFSASYSVCVTRIITTRNQDKTARLLHKLAQY